MAQMATKSSADDELSILITLAKIEESDTVFNDKSLLIALAMNDRVC
jgi:hypothetical protein